MKKIVITLLALGLLLQSTALADITVTERNGSTVVEGTIELGDQPYAADLTVTAYDPDGAVNYLDIIPLSKDGQASFLYENLGKSGDYTYVFSAPSLGIKETAHLSGFIGNDYWNAFCENVNNLIKNGDAQALSDAVFAEQEKLSLDLTDYQTLSDGLAVFTVMKADATADYQSAEEIIHAFLRGVALCKLKESKNAQAYYENETVALSSVLPKAEDQTKISVLDSLSGNAQKAVLDAIANKAADFQSNEDAKNAFLSEILYTGIKKAESYQDVKKLLNAYGAAGLLKVDQNMSEKVYKALTNQTYSSYSAIESAVADAKKSTAGGGGSSSSSSGGGNKKSDSGLVTSPVSPVTPVAAKDDLKSGQMIFSDMEDATWALDAVENLYQKKIVSGTGDGKFSPHQKVKREEMAKMLVDLTGYAKENTALPFYDASSDAWYYPYLCAAYANSVISGITENEFGIGMEITREQAAALVYRILKNQNVEMPGTEFRFADDGEIGEWAKEAVYALYSIGAINGKSTSQFAPKETMTRVEAAVLLNGVLGYFETKGGDAS